MWQPLSLRIVEMLRKHPEGLSSRRLSHLLVVRQEALSPILSKLLAYGAPIEKLNGNYGPRVIWRWKEMKKKKADLKIAASNDRIDSLRTEFFAEMTKHQNLVSKMKAKLTNK